jgi:hypothetical protein
MNTNLEQTFFLIWRKGEQIENLKKFVMLNSTKPHFICRNIGWMTVQPVVLDIDNSIMPSIFFFQQNKIVYSGSGDIVIFVAAICRHLSLQNLNFLSDNGPKSFAISNFVGISTIMHKTFHKIPPISHHIPAAPCPGRGDGFIARFTLSDPNLQTMCHFTTVVGPLFHAI